MVIIFRKALENAPKESGHNEENVIIVHQINGFNTALIFDYWLGEGQLYRYQGQCLLFFDGCTCY